LFYNGKSPIIHLGEIMPLNIRDTEEKGRTPELKPQPILRKQEEKKPLPMKLIIIAGGIVLLAIVLIWLYKAGVMSGKKTASAETEFTQSTEATTVAPAESVAAVPPAENYTEEAAKPEIAEKPTAKKTDQAVMRKAEKVKPTMESKHEPKRQSLTTETGQFTIYIASYSTKATAEDEVNRWNDAGYKAFVNEYAVKGRMSYRVCLGRYVKKADARQEAEKLKDAFESGYWIGEIK
jgi:septal ring-binding cell division protein DamX